MLDVWSTGRVGDELKVLSLRVPAEPYKPQAIDSIFISINSNYLVHDYGRLTRETIARIGGLNDQRLELSFGRCAQ